MVMAPSRTAASVLQVRVKVVSSGAGHAHAGAGYPVVDAVFQKSPAVIGRRDLEIARGLQNGGDVVGDEIGSGSQRHLGDGGLNDVSGGIRRRRGKGNGRGVGELLHIGHKGREDIRPGGSLGSLRSLRSLWSLGTLRSLRSLWPLGALRPLRPLGSFRPFRSLGSLRSLRSLWSLGPLGSFRPFRSLGSFRSLRPLGTLRPLGAGRSPGAGRTRISSGNGKVQLHAAGRGRGGYPGPGAGGRGDSAAHRNSGNDTTRGIAEIPLRIVHIQKPPL